MLWCGRSDAQVHPLAGVVAAGPEQVLLDLRRRRLRERRHDLDVPRHLERGQPLAAPGDELRGDRSRRPAGARRTRAAPRRSAPRARRRWRPTARPGDRPARARPRGTRRSRRAGGRCPSCGRRSSRSRPRRCQALSPVCSQPSRKRLGGALRVLEVAEHHGGVAQQQLADLARRDVVARVVDDACLGARDGRIGVVARVCPSSPGADRQAARADRSVVSLMPKPEMMPARNVARSSVAHVVRECRHAVRDAHALSPSSVRRSLLDRITVMAPMKLKTVTSVAPDVGPEAAAR